MKMYVALLTFLFPSCIYASHCLIRLQLSFLFFFWGGGGGVWWGNTVVFYCR
jgi:hypothetical protein